MSKYLCSILFFVYIFQISFAQERSSDTNISGHVICKGEHIPFANIYLKGTAFGGTTDESGHYRLINLPEGTFTVGVRVLGYTHEEKSVSLVKGETIQLNFELSEDALGLEEIVVTGDRNEKPRKESSVIVNSLSNKYFKQTQSVNLSEGLNFVTGLRTENNCSNCGFSQVRMNGLEGSYSQILINSQPIFSGLAGVYGLELIPAAMIERVEVIRGGGSTLYGSNAIAGTINLILRDPVNNNYEFGFQDGIIGMGVSDSGTPANDLIIDFNSSAVSVDNQTGMAIYGYYRKRKPFDVNNDSFSDLVSIDNNTLGARIFHRFGHRSKISLDFFNIKEDRRGGDKFEYPLHETTIAEAVEHSITTTALSFTKFMREIDLLSVYVSGQRVYRNSYYGANSSLSDYGTTKDFTLYAGIQYKANFSNHNFIVGFENKTNWLIDNKLGYTDLDSSLITGQIIHINNSVIAHQSLNTYGNYLQYEIKVGDFSVISGIRFDIYQVSDLMQESESNANTEGCVFSPRLNMLYNISNNSQLRLNYSKGYRAPQIFDEDLHIETSASRKVLHHNSPDLTQESSHSLMFSLDLSHKAGNMQESLLIESFYTVLINPFANNIGDPNSDGTVLYTRVNDENGASVYGLNLEWKLIPFSDLIMKTAYTIQRSQFKKVREFDERNFLHTPNMYGFISLNWKLNKSFEISGTSTFTGKMLVPYFGPLAEDPAIGELHETPIFFDSSAKIQYNKKINGATIQFFTGVKNIFNAYQSDIEVGLNRDPGYVYGPGIPRMIYFGIRLGNQL